MSTRPSRSALSRDWLAYFDALQDALICASEQDALALRFEITKAENELVRRALPRHALEPPPRLEWEEPYSPQAGDPDVQELFGRALAETGRKYKDEWMIRLGWTHQRKARETRRNEVGNWEAGMRLPDNCPDAVTPSANLFLHLAAACCRGGGRASILGAEELLCRSIEREDEVYRFV